MRVQFGEFRAACLRSRARVIINEPGFDSKGFLGWDDMVDLAFKMFELIPSYDITSSVWEVQNIYINDYTLIAVLGLPKEEATRLEETAKLEEVRIILENSANNLIDNIEGNLDRLLTTLIIAPKDPSFTKMIDCLKIYQDFFDTLEDKLCSYIPKKLIHLPDLYMKFVLYAQLHQDSIKKEAVDFFSDRTQWVNKKKGN